MWIFGVSAKGKTKVLSFWGNIQATELGQLGVF